MKPSSIRAVQGALVALVVTVLGLVYYNLRTPRALEKAPAPAEGVKPGATQMGGGFSYVKQDKDGKERFALKAESMVGQEQDEIRLRAVTMRFHYVANGKPGQGTVTGDRCTYTAANQKAFFDGHVVVTTEDGFELKTETLLYRGDKGVARTESPAEFRRGRLSGSATGLTYDSEKGDVKLLADAHLRDDPEQGPPVEIRSRAAEANREDAVMHFVDDVDAHRGADSLGADALDVFFDSESHELVGVSAIGHVVVHGGMGEPMPGISGQSGGKGPRTLTCQKLDVGFRPDRTIEGALAGPDADLVMLPGPGEVKERRRIQSRFLQFRFDEKGRLEKLQGQKDSTLSVEAIAPAKALPRTITSHSFLAEIDPETGQTTSVEFNGEVEMARGPQKARSERAVYDGAKNLLTLDKKPELQDAEDGGRLTARVISIGTQSGDVEAQGDVSHVLGHKTDARKPGLLDQERSTIITCARFEHTGQTGETRYEEGALMRSGADEIRAPLIRLAQSKTGQRTMESAEGVVSLLHPRENPGKKPAPPVETRARQMVYDEAKATVVYTGDVVMRQADIVSKSPEATVYLTPDGAHIQSAVAGEPVAIQQGARTASGQRGTYTPAEETVVLVGEKVVLKDPIQGTVQGRSVTFHTNDDRILVDGREEARTETVLPKEPPRP